MNAEHDFGSVDEEFASSVDTEATELKDVTYDTPDNAELLQAKPQRSAIENGVRTMASLCLLVFSLAALGTLVSMMPDHRWYSDVVEHRWCNPHYIFYDPYICENDRTFNNRWFKTIQLGIVIGVFGTVFSIATACWIWFAKGRLRFLKVILLVVLLALALLAAGNGALCIVLRVKITNDFNPRWVRIASNLVTSAALCFVSAIVAVMAFLTVIIPPRCSCCTCHC